jgi:hypothetical protein
MGTAARFGSGLQQLQGIGSIHVRIPPRISAQNFHARHGFGRGGGHFFMRERLLQNAGGKIGDTGKARHAQAGRVGQNRFRYGGHAHGIRAMRL